MNYGSFFLKINYLIFGIKKTHDLLNRNIDMHKRFLYVKIDELKKGTM